MYKHQVNPNGITKTGSAILRPVQIAIRTYACIHRHTYKHAYRLGVLRRGVGETGQYERVTRRDAAGGENECLRE